MRNIAKKYSRTILFLHTFPSLTNLNICFYQKWYHCLMLLQLVLSAIYQEGEKPFLLKICQLPRSSLPSTFVGGRFFYFCSSPSLSLIFSECAAHLIILLQMNSCLPEQILPGNWITNEKNSCSGQIIFSACAPCSSYPKYVSFILQYSNPKGGFDRKFFRSIPFEFIFIYNLWIFSSNCWRHPALKILADLCRIFAYFDLFL